VPVQATVSDFDPQTRSGAVLRDDGVRLPFGPEALAGTRLRFLRRGQRVSVAVGDDVVTRLQILTLQG
jgi:2-phospho-L-lactate/phosphoenolpyruvate guanylyltransferase